MSNKSGFTIERAIAIAVLGIFVIKLWQANNEAGRAKPGRAKLDIATYGAQLDLYARDNNGRYPDTLESLVSGEKKYIKQIAKDPWGHSYIYKNNGGSYEIVSAGPDGVLGNVDDVTTPSEAENS